MGKTTSKDQEVGTLLSTCQHLEIEAKRFEEERKRLESKLLSVQKRLCLEEQVVKHLKERRAAELKTLRKDYMEKFETAMNLLKVRVQVEMSQSLRRHKEQLKMSFRSDLLKLTRKNCQLTNLLHYIQRTVSSKGKKRSHCNRQFLLVDEELRLQQLERDSEIKRRSHCCCKGNKQVGDPCLFHEQDDIDCCHSADPRLQNLRTEFQKQIDKLLYELKEREEGIDELNKNVEEIHETKKTVLSPSPSSACSKEDSSTSTRSKNIKTGSKNEVGRSGAPSAAAHTDSSFIAATVAKSDVTTTTTGFVDGDDASIKPICTRSNNNNNSVGPVRNKNHRGIRESRTCPYDTSQALSSRRRRCNAVSSFVSSSHLSSSEKEEPTTSSLDSEKRNDGETTMRELDIPHTTLDCSQSYYAGHNHNSYHHHNVGHQQYHQQCGSSGLLETLPEAESEEEEFESISATVGKEDGLYRITRSPLVSSASPSSSSSSSSELSPQTEFPPEFTSLLQPAISGGKLEVAKSIEDFGMLQQCEAENQKISVLESIIRQLRDELKECKDQNELLEFRLLEMQELSASPVRPHQADVDGEEEEEDDVEPKLIVADVDGNPDTSKGVVACLPGSADSEYDGGNGHANVTESRSSCSDCSESLSLQESGIFDSQSTEDSPVSNVCRLTISRELVSLTFQIEELLRRFNEGVDEGGSGSPGIDTLSVSTRRGKTSHDLASELQSCRQRIQEFERRLAAMSDGNYIQSLEEKVNFLLNENRRLEDERAEIEEAENDNRLMCQRLEEKLGQLQKKKLILQNRLAAEKKCIEQLRVKILQMQEREEDLCSQISRLESLLQNYEQRNFELEESCIEMKCSVQFVIHSIPIFALCYFGALLRSTHGRSASVLNILLSLPSTVGVNIGRYLHVTHRSNALPFVPDGIVSPVPPTRKHKLRELSSPTISEEVEPKLKKLRRMLDKNGITCLCNCANCGNGRLSITDDDGSKEKALMTANIAEVQTGEELWKLLVEQIFAEQKHEWQKTEKMLLRKIEVLECDIDKCQEIFDRERGSLIKMYEVKLAEKESQLRETQACRNEKRDLQEKWNCLIQELEQFALYLGKNLSERSIEEQQEERSLHDDVQCNTLSSSATTTGVLRAKDDTSSIRVPTQLEVTGNSATGTISPESFEEVDVNEDAENNEQRMPSFICSSIIKSLRDSSTNNDDAVSTFVNEKVGGQETEVLQKTRIIYYLQSSLKEHLSTFEKREKHLLDQIDRLTQEIRQHSQQDSQHEGNMIAYLRQENERLVSLFQDHEKVWGDLQQLQEEHEKLKLEVGNTVTLRKKLEESQKTEAEMRDRLEELERTESHLKTQLSQLEKKEQKALEKIQQLRDEIQFLRTKCCQLQDDIDSRVTREAKYKNELQALTIKLKESSLELEEKESQLESNETALQAQIQKLKNQLTELHQAYADTECSNGMLREEVSYLERTVEEAIAKAVQSENTVTALSHELKQKDLTIEELQRKLQELTTCDPIASNVLSASSSALNPNDLADFNKHDGGLLGVARDVEEVVTLLQRCSVCEKLGSKLMDIVERLIVLIQILKASQLADGNMLDQSTSLSRCESEEILNPCLPGQSMDEEAVTPSDNIVNELSSTKHSKSEEAVEEEDLMIANLQETMTNLGSQIRNLEDAFYIRQKELRDSYMTETLWWKMRCEEKNKLIELLGRRIAQLCVTDIHGYFLDGILREIEKVRSSIGTCHLLKAHKESRELSRNRDSSSSCSLLSTSSGSSSTTTISCSPSPARQSWCPVEPPPRKRSSKKSKSSSSSVTTENPKPTKRTLLPSDFTCDSLCSYLVAERKRVMAILEDVLAENTSIDDSVGCNETPTSGKSLSTGSTFSSNVGTSLESSSPGLEFRVLKKIGDDSLLVSWSMPENHLLPPNVNGYEIAVNGKVFLRIPQPNRHKVILFGLNLDEPLHLTLRCSGDEGLEESTITYIN